MFEPKKYFIGFLTTPTHAKARIGPWYLFDSREGLVCNKLITGSHKINLRFCVCEKACNSNC